ncbi:hypothetical protein H0H93_002853 [Arthromyces matolae]|nr:hypothetical protein H0H93_002853 [Arthromyces matolae]
MEYVIFTTGLHYSAGRTITSSPFERPVILPPMKLYLLQGATICLVHLLILANASPVPPHKPPAKVEAQPESIRSTSPYGQTKQDEHHDSDAEGEEYDPAHDPFREYNMHITSPPSRSGELNADVDAQGEPYNEEEERYLHKIAAKESSAPTIPKDSQPTATMNSQPSYKVTTEELSGKFDRKRLFNRMLRDKVKAASGPWHIQGEWSTEVLQMMVNYMRTRKEYSGGSHRREDVTVKILDRSELVNEMDGLWKWAEDTLMGSHKRIAVDKAQVRLREIESGELKVQDTELIETLLASVPSYSSFDRLKMPWHDGTDNVYRWTQNLKIDYVKKVLPHIWFRLMAPNQTSEKQKIVDGGDTVNLLKAMDDAWRVWLERKARQAITDAARYPQKKH